MKTKFIIASLILSITLIACKEEKKEEQPQQPEVVKVDSRELFNVELELVVPQNDSLQLFYKDETMKDYEEGKSVWAAVKGDKNVQKVQFLLPKDVLPNDIRIDFGTNKKQESIEVKKFEMKYYDKAFSINDTLFFQYFQPNDQVNWDRKKAIAKLSYKDGVVYDPLFFPRETLKGEIQKIIK